MNGNMCPFTIIHDRCTDLYGYFRNACVTSQEHVALPVNLVELRCQSGASELTCVGVGAGLMDELFDFLIVKMVGGIFTLAPHPVAGGRGRLARPRPTGPGGGHRVVRPLP